MSPVPIRAKRVPRAWLATAALIAGVLAAPLTATASDSVREWNGYALIATGAQGPHAQLRNMALMHVAIHDAVNAISGEYETWAPHPAAPLGASLDAAVIGAGYQALFRIFPDKVTQLDLWRTASLATWGVSTTDPGLAYGADVANDVFARRAVDGSAAAQFPYVPPGAGTPGIWTPLPGQTSLLPGWGAVTPWGLRSGSQFRPEPPPALVSEEYTKDYNEIVAIGSTNSATRTGEQTNIARFWLGTPAGIWSSVLPEVLDVRQLDLSATARVYALMFMAGSDGTIACWDAKYTYNFWRPLPAIRNAAFDDNPATIPDGAWTPLIGTPAHPEYPSGHSTASSAIATILALLFGDDPGVTLEAVSSATPGFVRRWYTFSEGVDEVVDARVYSGIHFRTADEVGSRLGGHVGKFIFIHALRSAKEQ